MSLVSDFCGKVTDMVGAVQAAVKPRPCRTPAPFNVPWCYRRTGWPAGSVVYTNCGNFFTLEDTAMDPKDPKSPWIQFEWKILLEMLTRAWMGGDCSFTFMPGDIEGCIRPVEAGEVRCWPGGLSCAKVKTIESPTTKPADWSAVVSPGDLICKLINLKQGSDYSVTYACGGGSVPNGGIVAGIGNLFPALPSVNTGGKGDNGANPIGPDTIVKPTYLTNSEFGTGTGLDAWVATDKGWIAPYAGVVELHISAGVSDDTVPKPTEGPTYRITAYHNGDPIRKEDIPTGGKTSTVAVGGDGDKDEFLVQVAAGDLISHDIVASSGSGHRISEIQVSAEYKGCGTVTSNS